MTKIKIIVIVIVCVLLCTLAIGGLVYLLKNKLPSNKNNEEEKAGVTLLENEISTEGSELNYTASSGVKMKAIRLAKNSFAEYGIAEASESAYSITATVLPEHAADKSLNWSIAYEDPDHGWVQIPDNKNVEDFVSLTVDENTATISCIKPFGARIVIKATSVSNPEVSATCTLDYVQKASSTYTLKYGTYILDPFNNTITNSNGEIVDKIIVTPDLENNHELLMRFNYEGDGNNTYTKMAFSNVLVENVLTDKCIELYDSLGVYEGSKKNVTYNFNSPTSHPYYRHFDKIWFLNMKAGYDSEEWRQSLYNALNDNINETLYSIHMKSANYDVYFPIRFDLSTMVLQCGYSVTEIAFDNQNIEF